MDEGEAHAVHKPERMYKKYISKIVPDNYEKI